MSELFETVVNQFQSNNQYEKFIKESEKEFDIKIYRLAAFTLPHARTVYTELQEKYQDKTLLVMSQGWYENERRLYVWFIICFMQLKLIDPVKFVDAYDKYWRNISQVFWHKDVCFLKYQLLNIIKTKGRTLWKTEEDEFIKTAFKKHQMGEWNEVAKTFYRISEGRFFKTPKQCRERWQNHLNHDIKKGDWTVKEDLTIFQFVDKVGTKWAKIVPELHHKRTEHMIKNRYKSLLSKVIQERNVDKSEAISIILKDLILKDLQQNQEMNNQKQDEFQIQMVESVDIEDSQPDELTTNPKVKKEKYKPISKKEKNESIRSNLSRGKIPFDINKSCKQPSNLLRIDDINDGCKIQSFLGHHVFDDSYNKSSNSYISKMIILNSSHIYPTGSFNMGYIDDRSILGVNRSFKEAEEAPNHLFFESESIRSRRSAKNNESMIGIYLSEQNQTS